MVSISHLCKYPSTPGVYFFRNKKSGILYIGKASNLRERLRSYFAIDLGPAKQRMLEETSHITWRTTRSQIEALILEAQLIKKYRPKYNVLLRDDKQYFYVGFTEEDFPRVSLTHQTNRLADWQTSNQSANLQIIKSAEYIGPFTDGKAIKQVLKLLRRIFPYCTHRIIPKHCLWQDLKLCPIGKVKFKNQKFYPERSRGAKIKNDKEYLILKREYQKNIKAVKDVLAGKRQGLLRRLNKEMMAAAKTEAFERAARLRDQIASLENIFEHRSVFGFGVCPFDIAQGKNLDFTLEQYTHNLPGILKKLLPRSWPWRIEAYDVSNIQGTSATGSMVTFLGNSAHKDGYRKFRIRTVPGANDVAMLKEVIGRRLAHAEPSFAKASKDRWPLPNIMLIDGGRAQLNAALYALKQKHYTIYPSPYPLVISLAKRREELYIPDSKKPIRLPKGHPLRLLFIAARDEAHRFAKSYYKILREKTLFRDEALSRARKGVGEKRKGFPV